MQKGVKTDRRSRRHVAKFILMGLYTGTRSGAICGAALHPTVDRGWIDVDRGVIVNWDAKYTYSFWRPVLTVASLNRWRGMFIMAKRRRSSACVSKSASTKISTVFSLA
jgi:hypothetical protein